MKMSIREAINQTLHQEMERDERVIVLGKTWPAIRACVRHYRWAAAQLACIE